MIIHTLESYKGHTWGHLDYDYVLTITALISGVQIKNAMINLQTISTIRISQYLLLLLVVRRSMVLPYGSTYRWYVVLPVGTQYELQVLYLLLYV